MYLSKRTLIAAILAGALAVSASAAFAKTETYTDGKFADVPATEWYASEVAGAYELGLMKGSSDTTFEPEGNVTVAEAITMASRAAAIHAGETIPAAEGEWYQQYLNYAMSKGFVKDGQFDNYDRAAKRYEVASLFEAAMPDGYFAAQNDVTAIPDVSEKQPYQSELLTLYKAGVVMGSDSYGNFFPENNITRAEAAAIINRVALPENRLSKTLDKVSGDDAYMLVTTATFNGNKEAINSGWVLDNRGGVPKTELAGNYGTMTDTSTEAGVAMIRELNKTTTGVLRLETTVTTAASDGVYLEYRNDEDESVYRLEIIDRKWQIRGADGSFTPVYEPAKAEASYQFLIDVDLDNNRSTTYINGTNCGTHALATSGDKTNVLTFRFATTDKETPSVALGSTYINVNYAVRDNININRGWIISDGETKSTTKLAKDVTYTRPFDPVSGTVVAETFFLLPSSEAVTYSLRSGAKNLVTFTTDDKNFYANGEKVYENYYANIWYRLRIEADTDTQKAVIKINGYEVGTVDFAEAATSADNIVVYTSADSAPSMQTFRVFRKQVHDDYVPEPVVPKGEEKYTVGMNVCSLWTNGSHFGWSCISPFDDPEPVLGFYDELNSETADWEIKYMVEHGIDFGAYCVYFGSTSGPQNLGEIHLYNGFMNAEYSDMSKFCIIWEAANASSPSSFEAWKNDYVPYFIENFFKHPSHMTIDNKPVLCVFGAEKIATRLNGTNADVKKCFDYLEEEVKKLGYDGMIYLVCGSSSAKWAEMGFDGCYAYNWGNDGYQLAVNKNSVLSSAKTTGVYTVPTISVGFNSVPWHGTRYPMMSKSDFAAAQEWVKSDYFTTYPKEKWQENFVMISTWNEYGEGTYIMPSSDEKGFQYLDVLREAYTDEKEDASINTVPTAAQRERINHLYPQYRNLLRKEGYYVESVDADSLEVVATINYADVAGLNFWSTTKGEADENGIITSTATGNDPAVVIMGVEEDLDLSKIKAVRITAQVPEGNKMQMFFTSEAGPNWSEAQSVSIVSDSNEMKQYVYNLSNCTNWSGTLINLRFDPASITDVTYSVKCVEFLGKPVTVPQTMTINGLTFDTKLPTKTAENGDILVPFDPSVGMEYRLNTFYNWNKDTGVLTLNFINHTVVYTVGSDTYTLDGQSKSLGYKFDKFDGLPLLPIKQLCADVGYTYELLKDGTVSVETDQKDYFLDIINREPGDWEFDKIGDVEGWTSTSMTLLVGSEGYLQLQTLTQEKSGDPMMHSAKVELPAEKYLKLEYRVRYDYLADGKQQMVLYFITDHDSTWSESKTLKIDIPENSSNGEWLELSYDISKQPLWKDTITQVRFDPFNCGGTMDLDYIRLVADPNYVYVDPAKAPFTLTNPDAEDTKEVAFKNSAANISIVEDPDNKDNHYYQVLPKDDGKIWLYAIQDCRYKAGATYKVELDFRILASGTDTKPASDFKGTLLFNAQYSEPGASVDHVVARKQISVADGWQHFTFEFKVPDNSKRGSDKFSFYSDPVSDKGVGYAIDNIVVTEILPEE